jgi:hypothetical protein
VVLVTEAFIPPAGYVDILGVTASGTVIIVECKLRSNPEIRRSVLAQILTYGGALWGMSYDDFADLVAKVNKGVRPDEALRHSMEAVGRLWDESAFREAVSGALGSGRFRLIVAVDEIPEELERTVQYVNARAVTGPYLELLQLQYRQDGDVQILVPSASGLNPENGDYRVPKPQTTEEQLFDALRAKCSAKGYEAVRRIYDWSQLHGMSPLWGRRSYPSVIANFTGQGISLNPWELSVSSKPNLALNFWYLAKKGVPREWVEEFAHVLETTPGLGEDLFADLRDSDYQRFPLLHVDGILAQDGVADAIIEALDHLVSHLQPHGGSGMATIAGEAS